MIGNKLVLVAGLPRTGSTLLMNMLAQNSAFYIEGNSGLCQLMWDMQQSCDYNCKEQLSANNKLESVKDSVIGGLSDLYYKGISNKVIFDKCRPWVMPANLEMAKTYIDENVKVIVMVRPIDEIIRSFAKLHFASGGDDSIYSELLDDNSEVLMRSFHATCYAAKAKEKNCLFVSYENIVDDPIGVLSNIYSFINEDKFIHNTNKIEQVISENDSVYGLDGMHHIRESVSRLNNDVVLPEWVQEKANAMTNTLFTELRGI
tara:strand:- start:1544 stop:2323 length:780 start_codon:yes stop_codon:yes gene_type:complete